MAVVTRPKPFVAEGHWGVLLPSGAVAHSTPGRGEHISTLAEYGAGSSVEVVRYVPAERHEATVQRISAAMQDPMPHNPFTNNCQHFANRMTGEPAVSPAVAVLVVVAGLAGLFALAARA